MIQQSGSHKDYKFVAILEDAHQLLKDESPWPCITRGPFFLHPSPQQGKARRDRYYFFLSSIA